MRDLAGAVGARLPAVAMAVWLAWTLTALVSGGDEAVAAALATLVAATVAVLAHRPLARARSRVTAQSGRVERSSPPEPVLPPAVVAVLAGRGGADVDTALAATVAGLVASGAVALDGTDAERFRLSIPAGLVGSQPVDVEALRALRGGEGGPEALEVSGPPAVSAVAWRGRARATFRRDAGAQAASLGLREAAVSPPHAALGTLAGGVVVMLAGGPMVSAGVLLAVVGPFLAAAAAMALPHRLTPAGERARAEWLGYKDWLEASADLGDRGLPAVAVWGEHLVWGTALGLCPLVVEAVAPAG